MSLLGNLKIVEPAEFAGEEMQRGEAGPKIVEAALAVHAGLGAGLDAEIYREALVAELQHKDVPLERDVAFPVTVRDKTIQNALKVDFVVGNRAVVMVVAEEKTPAHDMKIRSLLKVSGKEEAFIVNFRMQDMRKGIMRAAVQKGNILQDIKKRSDTVN